ncbi:aldehyde dehydrogenase family protein [Leucobacter sp. CSA1]|uniref:Aldehyde dehydrogenase family protein n=1 Tax=Leucobacter chromiisoli TaxID=2796471 RepID=A0A934UVF4_9MICO|nr:aldehyde dehydrogenase family protein [Leucobacter chromiisoli]MBK0419406.1 aldehyde dehydrogenase family protein [Leucobacter chromiisoli]
MTTRMSGVRIDGTAHEQAGNRTIRTVTSPIDGAAVGEVVRGTSEDAAAALDSAERAFPSWSATSAEERAVALRGIARELRAEAESGAADGWAWLLSTETGKRLGEAQGELNFSALYFETFARLVLEQEAEQFSAVPGISHRVAPVAMGVVAALTPWNFPVSIPARKIAAALAAGCTVVFRSSEIGALSSLRLIEIVERFVPSGVVNTVLGAPADVVDPWLERADCVSFTGSTRVGRILNEQIAGRFLPAVMELGGNGSLVVLDDADVARTVDTLMIAKFRNNGQSCIAANNVLVPKRLESDFRDALREAVEGLVVGDPREAGTGLGPLAPAGDGPRVSALVEAAVAAGGERLLDEREVPAGGHYAAPQFVFGAPAGSDLVAHEVFGPAAGVVAYDDVEDAIALQRSSGYGLASYVCGGDEERAGAVAARFRAGIVGINTGTPNYPGGPFGGVGLSGLGYEGGRLGLEAHQHFRMTAMAV